MTYARSYATSGKPKKANKFRRASNKRKIDQLHFRRNTFQGNPRSWQKLKTIFLGTGVTLCAASLVAGFSLLLVIGYQYLHSHVQPSAVLELSFGLHDRAQRRRSHQRDDAFCRR